MHRPLAFHGSVLAFAALGALLALLFFIDGVPRSVALGAVAATAVAIVAAGALLPIPTAPREGKARGGVRR